jgi:hypothetical protein
VGSKARGAAATGVVAMSKLGPKSYTAGLAAMRGLAQAVKLEKIMTNRPLVLMQ